MSKDTSAEETVLFDHLHVTEYRFAGERAIESLWPFNRVSPPVNYYLLIVAYFAGGIALVVLFQIPFLTVITGGFAALGIVIWTWALTRYATYLRGTKIHSLNKTKSKFLGAFLETVFSDFALAIAIAFYVMTIAYLFTLGNDVIPRIAGYRTMNLSGLENWLIYSYFLLMAFDVDVRMWLTVYIVFCLQKRNVMLSKLLRTAKTRAAFERRDLEAMVGIDKGILPIIASQVLFYPFSYYDVNLQRLLTVYIVVTLLLVATSMIQLKRLERKYFDLEGTADSDNAKSEGSDHMKVSGLTGELS